MRLFADMVCYQEEVRDPSRIAEVLNRVIEKAWRGAAPAQINVPRDFWTQVIDIELPQIVRLERSPGGQQAIDQAAKLLSEEAAWDWARYYIEQVFEWTTTMEHVRQIAYGSYVEHRKRVR